MSKPATTPATVTPPATTTPPPAVTAPEKQTIDNPYSDDELDLDNFLDSVTAPAPTDEQPKPKVVKEPATKEPVKPVTTEPPAEPTVEVTETDDDDLDDEDLDPLSKKLLGKKKPATEKKEDKKEDDIDLEKIDVPADSSPKTKKAFAIARGEAVKLRKELAELKEKGTVPEAVTRELEILKQQLSEYKSREDQVQDVLYRTELESSALYQNEIVQPKNSLVSSVKEIAQAYGSDEVSAAQLWNVVTGRLERDNKEEGKEITRAIMQSLSDDDRISLVMLKKEYSKLEAKDTALRSNQKATVEKYNAAQRIAREEAEKRITEESTRVYNECFKQVRGYIEKNPIFQIADDDSDEVKASINRIHEEAQGLDPKAVIVQQGDKQYTLTQLTPGQLAQAAYALPVAAYLHEQVAQLQETIKKQAIKLKRLKGGNPGFKGTQVTPPAANDDDLDTSNFLNKVLR